MRLIFLLTPYPLQMVTEPDPPAVARLWERFRDLFREYGPVRLADQPDPTGQELYPAYRKHAVEVGEDDGRVDALIRRFTEEVESSGAAGGHVSVELSDSELARARYVPFGAWHAGDDELDSDLNPFPQLCKTCGWRDFGKIPTPLWLSRHVRKRAKEELFQTREGIVIVRARLLEILREAIGPQIAFGPACVVGEKLDAVAEAERLWWVRPLHAIGARADWRIKGVCPQCRRAVLADHSTPRRNSYDRDESFKRFGDGRPVVDGFGEHGADLVRIDDFVGWMEPNRPTVQFSLAMSGALRAHLKKMKVGGVLGPHWCPDRICLRSARGEAAFAAEVKTFATPGKERLKELTPQPKPKKPEKDAEQVRRSVAQSWARIDAWLKTHATRVFEALSVGASEQEIAAAEKKLKVKLPEDVKASYRIHGGGEESDLFPSSLSGDMGYSLFSLKEVVEESRSQRDVDGWGKAWLAIARNGCGDYQAVDLAGDETDPGTQGRVIEFQHEECDWTELAKSWEQRLRDLADGLESGRLGYDEVNGIERRED